MVAADMSRLKLADGVQGLTCQPRNIATEAPVFGYSQSFLTLVTSSFSLPAMRQGFFGCLPGGSGFIFSTTASKARSSASDSAASRRA